MIVKTPLLLIFFSAITLGRCFSQVNREADFFNVKDYGAAGDGKTKDTKAIDAAVDACVKAGGGTVYFPAGSFLTGSFQLFSNVNLYLGPGSVILASTNKNDYFFQKDYGFSGSGAGDRIGLIFAHDAQNVSITGQGTVDGRGTYFMYMDSLQYGMDFDPKYTRQGTDYMNPKYGRKDGPVLWKGTYADRPGTEIIFSSCTNVNVSGITIREAANWSLHFLACNDVKVSGISIKNNMAIPNSDGIDMYDSENITISGCDIRAGDDAIAVISSHNVAVTNCMLSSRSSGIRIGYNVFNQNPTGNLLFDNLRIYDANRGIGIFQRQEGNMENMIFSNIIISTRLHSGQWWGHGEPIHISAVPGLGSKKAGEIKNIHFTNIIAKSEEGIVIYGSKQSVIKDISFSNIRLTIKNGPLTKSYGGNFDLRPTNDISMGIFRHDIPALFAKNIDNLRISDFELSRGDSLPDFFTHAIECENFNRLTIDGLSDNASPNKQAVISLRDGEDALLRDIRPDNKSAKICEKVNVSGYRISGSGNEIK